MGIVLLFNKTLHFWSLVDSLLLVYNIISNFLHKPICLEKTLHYVVCLADGVGTRCCCHC